MGALVDVETRDQGVIMLTFDDPRMKSEQCPRDAPQEIEEHKEKAPHCDTNDGSVSHSSKPSSRSGLHDSKDGLNVPWCPPYPGLSASIRWSELSGSLDDETNDFEVQPETKNVSRDSNQDDCKLDVSSLHPGGTDTSSSPLDTEPPVEFPTTEPAHTTIGFDLFSSFPMENAKVIHESDIPSSAISTGVPPVHSAAAGIDGVAAPFLPPGCLTRSSESMPRRGYAGALSMLYSAAHASADDTKPGFKFGPARVEAVLPVDNDENVKSMVRRAARGFKAEQEPQVPREGMGGTYFLLDDSSKPAGIFKPCDEEPLAPNNPKGWDGRALGAPGYKPSVRVGEAALREVAAYLLDHGGFAGVPPACLVLCRHSKLNYKIQVPRIESMIDLSSVPGACDMSHSSVRTHLSVPALPGGLKLGSLQAFATHTCDANDLSPSHFTADNVHRIGILDIRLLNADRHLGNLLVADTSESLASLGTLRAPYQLIPIDHGYALPEALESPFYEWLYWPQTNVPFSDAVREYVQNLDSQADIAMLRNRLPALRLECLRCLEVTTQVLKSTVAAGLSLFEIASIFTRPPDELTPSDFEAICMDARTDALQCAVTPTTPHQPSPTRLPALKAKSPAPQSGKNTSPIVPDSPYYSLQYSMGRLSMDEGHFNTTNAIAEFSGSFETLPEECSTAGDALHYSAATSRSDLPPAQHLDFDDTEAEQTPVCTVTEPVASPSPHPPHPGDPFTFSLNSPCTGDPIEKGSAPRLIGSPWLSRSPWVECPDTSPEPAASPPHLTCFTDPCRPGLDRSKGLTSSYVSRNNASGLLAQRSMHPNMNQYRSVWQRKHVVRCNVLSNQSSVVPESVDNPNQAKYVFSGLTDAQWRVMLECVDAYVGEEIARGTWRTNKGSAPVAGSCPEPFRF